MVVDTFVATNTAFCRFAPFPRRGDLGTLGNVGDIPAPPVKAHPDANQFLTRVVSERLRDAPLAGKGGLRLVLYHHGLMPRSTSAVLLVPELRSGIVTVQNSMPAMDTAEFILQMLLEALLDVPEPNDYVERNPLRRRCLPPSSVNYTV